MAERGIILRVHHYYHIVSKGLTIEIQRAKDNAMVALPSNDLSETPIHLSNSSKFPINWIALLFSTLVFFFSILF